MTAGYKPKEVMPLGVYEGTNASHRINWRRQVTSTNSIATSTPQMSATISRHSILLPDMQDSSVSNKTARAITAIQRITRLPSGSRKPNARSPENANTAKWRGRWSDPVVRRRPFHDPGINETITTLANHARDIVDLNLNQS